MELTNQPEWLDEKNRRHANDFSGMLDESHRVINAYVLEPQYVNALEMAYRYCVLEDPDVGTSEIGNVLADALSEAMGPTAFMRWLAEMTDDYEPRDKLI